MQYRPTAVMSIKISSPVKKEEDMQADIAINSPAKFIEGGAPKLKAAEINQKGIILGKRIKSPLDIYILRVLVNS